MDAAPANTSSTSPLGGKDAFRAAFPICETTAYFQTAYRGPIHRRTISDLQALMQEHAMRGADAREEWFSVYPIVAKALADWHHAPLGWLAFTPNCSWSIGAIAHGLDWNTGDEILIPANEFPANVYPWMTAAKRFGLDVRKVPTDEAGRVSADALTSAIGPKTRLIAASHVSFATGYRLDIAKLCGEARTSGVLTLIDAAQSCGWCNIDVPTVGCDFMIGAGRKFFCALDGLAWIFVRPEVLDRLTLVAPGPFSVVHDREYLKHETVWRPDAWRLTGGAVPTYDIFALRASLELFRNCFGGPEKLEADVLALAAKLRARLGSAEIGFAGNGGGWSEPEFGATTFLTEVSESAQKRLKEKRVSVSARFGGARVSCHGFNNDHDIGLLLNALTPD
jgi:selenocysteine lyase/cysteine desulfurase